MNTNLIQRALLDAVMLSAQQVRILDINAAWHGVAANRLMENAGAAVAQILHQRWDPQRVLVLCGPGNNGGDGAVAARYLSTLGANVTVLFSRDPSKATTPEARLAFHRLTECALERVVFSSARQAKAYFENQDLVLDALLGIGAHGPLRAEVAALARLANQAKSTIVSLDVPTGLGAPNAVRPQATLTLHAPKEGMTKANSGTIEVLDIGIPDQAQDVGPGDLVARFPRNEPGSHKGQNGRVLIVSGGPYLGAPVLSCMGALRAGADMVHLYAPREAALAAAAQLPDVVVHRGVDAQELVPADVEPLQRLFPKVDAMLIGPGLGRSEATGRAVERILALTAKARLPILVDADALYLLRGRPRLIGARPALLTPHPGEYKDLTGRALPRQDAARARAAKAAARALRCTLFLKGPTDILTDGQRVQRNTIHHPWMTVGGTGDVLAGACATMMAKRMAPMDAGAAAAFLCGAAALQTFSELSWSSRASDLAARMPHVFRHWLGPSSTLK